MFLPSLTRRAQAFLMPVAALVLTTASLSAPAAQAAAGGCNTYSVAHSSVGICINNRNYGDRAYPDYYVNAPLPANCKIVVEIWDNHNRRYGDEFQDTNSCGQGHHPPADVTWCQPDWRPVTAGQKLLVHSYFRLYINGSQVNDTTTNSPSITVTSEGENDCHGG